MIGHDGRATYLLSDGTERRGDQPWCFYDRQPHRPSRTLTYEQHDGLWALVPSDDRDDATGYRIVAWLSPHGEAICRQAQSLHEFRDAVRARYPTARIKRNRFYANGVEEAQVMIDDRE
jgi:hypothetical protein